LRIPIYKANFNPSNRAPGTSIRARKDFSGVKAKLEQSNVLGEFLGNVSEIALTRYRVAEELKLNENLLAAESSIRQLEYNMGRDNNPYSVLDGENPRWFSQIEEIKKTLRGNIGTNVNSVSKFLAKFNMAEMSARLRLRPKIDASIAARAALAKKQATDLQYSGLGSNESKASINKRLDNLGLLSRNNYKVNKEGKTVLTKTGLLDRQGHITEMGKRITTEWVKENPLVGPKNVLDLMQWSQEGAVFDPGGINEGVYFTLSEMEETERTEFLSKLFNEATTSYNKFVKLKEDQEKLDETKLKDAMSNMEIVNPGQSYSIEDARAIIEKVSSIRGFEAPTDNGVIIDYFKKNEDGLSTIDIDGDGLVRGIDIQAIMAQMFQFNAFNFGLDREDLNKVDAILDERFLNQSRFTTDGSDDMIQRNVIQMNTNVGFGFDSLSPAEQDNATRDISWELDLLEDEGTLTASKLLSYANTTYNGKPLFMDRQQFLNWAAPYYFRIQNQGRNKAGMAFIKQISNTYARDIGANENLADGEAAELMAKKVEHVNKIRSDLEAWLIETTLENIEKSKETAMGRPDPRSPKLISNADIRAKFNEIKTNYDATFKADIFQDFIEVLKAGLARNARSPNFSDQYPALSTDRYKYQNLENLIADTDLKRNQILQSLLTTAEDRLDYAADTQYGSVAELKKFNAIIDIIKNQKRIFGYLQD
jgi:hypothetical protein